MGWSEFVADPKNWLTFLSGGLAGSALTNGIVWWKERRDTRRLEINTKTVQYSLPGQGGFDLSVRYKGEPLEVSLSFFEITVTNVSQVRDVDVVRILLTWESPSGIMEDQESGKPKPIVWKREPVDICKQEITCGPLQPGDSATYGVLSSSGVPSYQFRGDRKIQINENPSGFFTPTPRASLLAGIVGGTTAVVGSVVTGGVYVLGLPQTWVFMAMIVGFTGSSYFALRMSEIGRAERSRR